ncbi:MAG: hypothetical protein K940chlam5_00697 [Candidatus Anoxychlamydiales bacterium]|nr:hypothetical protein [Candidatus Anoxychlamydiales bacterium]
MTIPISPSSTMNGYHRGKQERVHLKKRSKITWKTHDYIIQSKNSSFFSFCGSNIHLDTPLTDRVTFEKNIQAIIVDISLEKGSHRGERLSDIKLKTLKENTLRATTIPKRISEAFEKYEYDFLEPFNKCYDPQEFSEKYADLDRKFQKLFVKIIGGDEALKIIQVSDFTERLEKALEIVERRKSIENTRIPIEESNEQFYDKIQTLEEKQIRDTFRYFQSEKMFGKEGFIFLNNNSLKLPDLSSIDDEGEEFIKWLREQITSEITKEKELIAFILPCLSFNVFRSAHVTLHKTFPSFFQTNLYSTRLKLDSSKPTRFFINKVEKKAYEIVQEKKYSLITYLDDTSKQDCKIGKIKVGLYFKLNAKREIISKELYIKDLVFFDNVDLQTQIDILKKMTRSEKEEV